MKADKPQVAAVRVKLPYATVEIFVAEFASHVSRTGIFLRSQTPKPVDTRIKLELVITGGVKVLQGSGVVRWISAGHDNKNPGMGVEWDSLTDDSRTMVERLVAAHKGMGNPEFTGIPGEPADGDDWAARLAISATDLHARRGTMLHRLLSEDKNEALIAEVVARARKLSAKSSLDQIGLGSPPPIAARAPRTKSRKKTEPPVADLIPPGPVIDTPLFEETNQMFGGIEQPPAESSLPAGYQWLTEETTIEPIGRSLDFVADENVAELIKGDRPPAGATIPAPRSASATIADVEPEVTAPEIDLGLMALELAEAEAAAVRPPKPTRPNTIELEDEDVEMELLDDSDMIEGDDSDMISIDGFAPAQARPQPPTWTEFQAIELPSEPPVETSPRVETEVPIDIDAMDARTEAMTEESDMADGSVEQLTNPDQEKKPGLFKRIFRLTRSPPTDG